MDSVGPQELHARLSQAGPPRLVDVREPWEFELCHIDGSENIPMGMLQERLESVPRDAALVLICHHGMRSLQVAQYLESLGYEQVTNLDGGVDGWARTVDPDMPQY